MLYLKYFDELKSKFPNDNIFLSPDTESEVYPFGSRLRIFIKEGNQQLSLKTCWVKLTDEELKSECFGLQMGIELLYIVHNDLMHELGYWKYADDGLKSIDVASGKEPDYPRLFFNV
jgi:hypothetical protein